MSDKWSTKLRNLLGHLFPYRYGTWAVTLDEGEVVVVGDEEKAMFEIKATKIWDNSISLEISSLMKEHPLVSNVETSYLNLPIKDYYPDFEDKGE